MLRVVGLGVGAILIAVLGVLIAALTIRPADLHDFESDDFYKTSAAQTDPGDATLLTGWSYDQSLGGDLSEVTGLDIHVYPNFLPEVRRYAWYPYRSDDSLTVTPQWSAEVASVTVNGEAHEPSDPISLSAENHGSEVSITAKTADGARVANYVILTLPYNFPPLRTKITDPSQVSPGMITGMQAAPNNETYPRPKVIHALLYNQGIAGALQMLKKAQKKPYDDFVNVQLCRNLDCENREYLPFVNFVLDKNGTPLKYNNTSPRTIFLPFTTEDDGGLLPKHGFAYKEIVMNDEAHFAEAISRSFVAPIGEASRMEVPRHLDQFDDGHHITVTPHGTLQNLFYRMHPKGTVIKNGDVLDVNVTSTYLYELNDEGEISWEWDSIDHFPPSSTGSYLPSDRYHYWDYFHTNGVRFAPGGDQLLVSARYLRSIANVEYPSGEVNWVLGDPAGAINQFTYIDDPLGGVSSLHAAVMRSDDEILVFDNGHYPTSEFSEGSVLYDAPIQTRHEYTRVVKYKLDFEAMTATYQREWTYPEFMVRTAGYLMFVPRQEQGDDGDTVETENLLISWGSGGAFTEYNAENELILSADTGGMTYRFYKYDLDHWMNP
ncbi:MAG: aryl-sulfate sulfotransferase [Pseudomonadota bacterium]